MLATKPNDRQWQSEDDKCHRSADKHCKHTHPPTSFAALQTRGLSSEKRAGGRIYPAAPQQVEKARRPLGLAALELNDCWLLKPKGPFIRLTFVGDADATKHATGRWGTCFPSRTQGAPSDTPRCPRRKPTTWDPKCFLAWGCFVLFATRQRPILRNALALVYRRKPAKLDLGGPPMRCPIV